MKYLRQNDPYIDEYYQLEVTELEVAEMKGVMRTWLSDSPHEGIKFRARTSINPLHHEQTK